MVNFLIRPAQEVFKNMDGEIKSEQTTNCSIIGLSSSSFIRPEDEKFL